MLRLHRRYAVGFAVLTFGFGREVAVLFARRGETRLRVVALWTAIALIGLTLVPAALELSGSKVKAATPAAGGEYVPIPADRIIDTRQGTQLGGTTLGPASTMTTTVTGQGGVPSSGVLAVALNITTVNSTTNGFFTAWAAGTPRPGTSTLNESASAPVNNFALVQLSANGEVSFYNDTGTTDLVVDVEGYVTNSTSTAGQSTYVPVTPSRVLNTLNGTGAPQAPLGAGGQLTFTVSGVPTGASAVVLDLAAVQPTVSGYLTAWQAGTTRPADASVNSIANQNVQKTVTVPVSSSSTPQVSVYNTIGSVNVIADLEGYFTSPSGTSEGDTFIPIAPTRVLDTRNGTGGTTGR